MTVPNIATMTATGSFLVAGLVSAHRQGPPQSLQTFRTGVSTPRALESIEIFTGAFDRDGRNVAWLTQEVEVNSETKVDGFRYDALARLQLRPGRYEIRVAARHERAGRVGSVYAYVEVPDFANAGLRLSGVVLGSPSTSLATPKEAVGDLTPVLPTSQREFARTGSATAFVRVYQGGNDAASSVSVRARIQDAASTIVFDQRTTLRPRDFDTARGAEWQIDLPLAPLAPGPYLLTIEAARGPKDAVRRDVRFAVQ
jgi:hypothetical protein